MTPTTPSPLLPQVALYDVHGDRPQFVEVPGGPRVKGDDRGGGAPPPELSTLMPLERWLAPVGAYKDELSAAVEALGAEEGEGAPQVAAAGGSGSGGGSQGACTMDAGASGRAERAGEAAGKGPGLGGSLNDFPLSCCS